MENRRRFGVGDRQLRSGDEPVVLGHRQRRPVDGRPAARRQLVHRVDGCHRRGDRSDQGPHAVQPERIVGLGRSVAADSDRLPARRPHDQRARQRRAQRHPVFPRALRQARSTSSKRCRSCGTTSFAASIRRPGAPMSTRRGSRAPTRWRTSARRGGAERTGRPRRSTRRRACSTFPPTRICARR